MTSRLSWLMLGAAVLSPAVSFAAAPVHRFSSDHVLGAPFGLTVVGANGLTASMANLAARAEIDRLEMILSGWRDDSELAALNRSQGAFSASPDLFGVISACEAWRDACPGVFSARMGGIEAEWNEAVRQGALEPAALRGAAMMAENAAVRLDEKAQSIDRNGVVFAIDGLAKGYIVDAAFEAAWRAAPNARGMMLEIGGDLVCRGEAPAAGGWRVGIAEADCPDNVATDLILNLKDGAVASSGAGARDRSVGGHDYAHTLSPVDGAARPTRLATVQATSAAEADALATVAAVMRPTEAVAFSERTLWRGGTHRR